MLAEQTIPRLAFAARLAACESPGTESCHAQCPSEIFDLCLSSTQGLAALGRAAFDMDILHRVLVVVVVKLCGHRLESGQDLHEGLMQDLLHGHGVGTV